MLIGVDAVALAGPKAGVARYLRETLSHMIAEAPGVSFVLYSPVPIDAQLPVGDWCVRVPKKGRPPVPGVWLRDTLPRMIAEDRADVFWGQNQMMPSRWFRPCRRVLTVHDITGSIFPEALRLGHRLSWCLNFRAAVRSADVIVAVSIATASLLSKHVGVPVDSLSVVYPGRTREIEPVARAAARREVAERFALPDSYILTVGTLEPRKDHPTLLAALDRTAGLPLLVIAGGVGWRSRGILEQVRRAERKGRARYLGRVSDRDLGILYSAARLTVYPSFYEGFGSPVAEAMACGSPVLCSWSSSLPEVGGSAACYFRPHDSSHLALQLRTLLNDDVRLSEMGFSGVRQAAKFAYHDTAEQMLDLLRGQPRLCRR